MRALRALFLIYFEFDCLSGALCVGAQASNILEDHLRYILRGIIVSGNE